MEISKGKMFRTLYKKDMLLGKNETLLILGFIVVANLFLIYKANTTWPMQPAFGISTSFLTVIPLIIFIKAFTSISGEWKENTVYLMMSLPVGGKMIFLSKLLALVTQFLILVLVAVPFTAFLAFNYILDINDLGQVWASINAEMVRVLIQVMILATTGFALALMIVFLSTLIGRMFKKFSGLISFIVFLAINYAIGEVASWFPVGADFQLVSVTDFLISEGYLLILTVIVFLATTTLYDKKVEL